MAYRVKVTCIGKSEEKVLAPYTSESRGLCEIYRSFQFQGWEPFSFSLKMNGGIEEDFEIGKEYYVDFVKVIANPRREKDVEAPHGLTPVENPNF